MMHVGRSAELRLVCILADSSQPPRGHEARRAHLFRRAQSLRWAVVDDFFVEFGKNWPLRVWLRSVQLFTIALASICRVVV